jgi:hypothetical protein
MNYNLFSIISSKLKNNQIKSICLLKDKQWKFGIKSQIKWYRKNIKKNDIHNLFYIKSKLVGYTLLRKRTYEIRSLNKRTNYLLFDTLIIDKKYRGKNLSNLLMSFNNTIINQSGYSSFLICKKELVNFYKIKLYFPHTVSMLHLFTSSCFLKVFEGFGWSLIRIKHCQCFPVFLI